MYLSSIVSNPANTQLEMHPDPSASQVGLFHMTGVPQQVSVAAKSYGWDGQMPAERSRQVTVCKMIIISFRAALSEDGSQLL